MDDQRAVAVQIQRPLRARVEIVSRCHLGLPVAVRVPPLLEDGTPFPTLFWLSCPLAVKRVSRLEGSGGVRAMERRAAAVPEFGESLQRAHADYASRREALTPADADPRPGGGVAGAERGVKCLHAHYAHFLAGGGNPVGEMTAPWVEPLDCALPCVIEQDGEEQPNPRWSAGG